MLLCLLWFVSVIHDFCKTDTVLYVDTIREYSEDGQSYLHTHTHTQMRELEIPKSVAERSLREHKGDLIKALHALTD